MGDSVERALEETIPILQAAKRAKLLNADEINEVVRKRRNHEYALLRKDAARSDFLLYASFERELAKLLQKRADKKKLKKKKVQLIIGKTSSRVNLVYSRAVKSFRGDVDLWLHYARHCVKTGSVRTAQKVLAKAIAYRSDSERVWLAAVALHFDSCGDTQGARSIAQRALRALPDSVLMWEEYFRVEVCYLSKLIVRRLALGLRASGAPSDTHAEASKTAENAEEKDESPVNSEPGKEGSGEERESDNESDTDDAGHDTNDDETSDSSGDDAEEDDDGSFDTSDSESYESNDQEADESVDTASPVVEKLSFWNGGVPMAVFRRACEKVKLSEQNLVDFWDTAADTPYLPPQLLKAMVHLMRRKFPDRLVSHVIEVRSEWDSAHSAYKRKLGEGAQIDSTDADAVASGETMERKKVLGKVAVKVNASLVELLAGRITSTCSETTRAAIRTCVESYRESVKGISSTSASEEQIQPILSLLSMEPKDNTLESASESPPSSDDSESDATHWSLAKLEEELKSECGSRRLCKEGTLLEAVKRKALVPFRGLRQEQVVCMYLSRERDTNLIREASAAVMSTPPVTMQAVRAAIDAELRIADESLDPLGNQSKQVVTEDTVSHVRKLFRKATTLSASKRDVDFWLCYLDFERRITRDSRAAAGVHAKALRVLDRANVELFAELQTLRNLAA